jgi:hypothetical protein
MKFDQYFPRYAGDAAPVALLLLSSFMIVGGMLILIFHFDPLLR